MSNFSSPWELAKFVIQCVFIAIFIVYVILLIKKKSKALAVVEILECCLGAGGMVLAFAHLDL